MASYRNTTINAITIKNIESNLAAEFKKSVMSFFSESDTPVKNVMSAGRALHARGPATEKALSET